MLSPLYDTYVLTEVMSRTVPDTRFFFKPYFNRTVIQDKDTILIDELEDKKLFVTPYAHPREPAKLMKRDGYSTKAVRPAYLKEMHVVDPEATGVRLPGEALGGALSDDQREQLMIYQTLGIQREMFERRLEQMRAEALVTGKLLIRYDGNPLETVDFNRDKSLSIKLKENEFWSKPDADIPEIIEKLAQKMADVEGAICDHLVLGKNVWAAFRKNPSVRELLDLRRGTDSNFLVSPNKAIYGIKNHGTIGSYSLTSHHGYYIDPLDDKRKPYVPDDSVLFLSPEVEGTQYFGKIKDREAKMKGMKFFSKADEQKNPSALYLISQSAPLVVPGNPNASMCVKVL